MFLLGDVQYIPPKAPEFVWARLQYSMDHDDTALKGYYTDYPEFDMHAAEMLTRLTNTPATNVLVKPSSRNVFHYPFILMVEPEQAIFSDEDARNMQEWFRRGGFMWLDDFHGDLEWSIAIKALRRILPDAVPIEITAAHPLFHVFFDIGEIIQAVNDGLIECSVAGCDQFENGESGRIPRVFAVYNAAGDMQALITYNNDIGDSLEWLDSPRYPRAMATFGVRLSMNMAIWTMTH